MDDDCNGVMDDLLLDESTVGDFPQRTGMGPATYHPVTFPGKITGLLSGGADTEDRMQFTLPVAGRVSVTTCSVHPIDTARVQVSATLKSGATLSAMNPANFRIEPPLIIVTFPSSPGLVWTAGTKKTVTCGQNLGSKESVKLAPRARWFADVHGHRAGKRARSARWQPRRQTGSNRWPPRRPGRQLRRVSA